jgi:large subunit ribosomal protein L32e
MKDQKKLLEVRKKIKAKKPEFIQQDYHKKRRLSLKWKRPTGLQSKMRHQFKGYNRRVKQGWRSPAEIRGFHGLGYESVIISTLKDLDAVKKNQGIIVSSTVGTKKKLAILEKAVQLKIPVLNLKIDSFKKKITEKKAKAIEDKKTREEQKKKTLEDSVKKSEKLKADKEKIAKNADKAEDTIVEEEKKEKEKKEKDDVLIHKQ